MTCLNEFLNKLKTTPHGTSNLLDNTLVYVTSDTAWGKIHDEDRVAGAARGQGRTDACAVTGTSTFRATT